MSTNNEQTETILHLSKEGADLGEFHGGLEDFLRFAMAHGIEEQLDGMHVAREVKYSAQHQEEDNQHEQ